MWFDVWFRFSYWLQSLWTAIILLSLHFLVKPLSVTILKHDSWKILTKILLSAKEVKPNQNYSQFAKIVNNIPQFCAHGYACRALGMSVRDIRYPMLSNNAPYGVLGKLGFSNSSSSWW